MKGNPIRELSMWACRCDTNVVVESHSKAWRALHAATAPDSPTLDLLFGSMDVEYTPPVGALEIKAMTCPCCGRPMSRVEPQKILASFEAGRAAFDAGEPLPRLEPGP